jgi:diphthine synthase
MLYLIGLGLSEKGISQQGIEAVEKCKKIYLENYTVDFPYSIIELGKFLGKKIIPANREFVEGMNEILEEAKMEDVALLVYGSPLTATTHIILIQEAKRKKVKYEIIYSASVIDAVAECGLQLYKFGKIASIPKFNADSFIEIIKENQKIGAHSLILVDIGLEFREAIKRMENGNLQQVLHNSSNQDKIVVCSRLGAKEGRICYGTVKELENKEVKAPFCFIIPGKLHFIEEEVLLTFS